MSAKKSLEALPQADRDQRTMVSPAVPVLVVTSEGELHGRTLALGDLTIGRAPGSDLRLDDPYVSRHHAVVRQTGDELVIEDAGSRAGVVVNDVPTSGPTVLREGDRVRLGRVELELRRITGASPDPGIQLQAVQLDGKSEPTDETDTAGGGRDVVASPEFVTERSMTTYAGASGAVVAVWEYAKAFVGTQRWVCLVIAGAAALALQAASPPQPADRALWRKVVVGGFLLLANTALLSAAALGFGEAAGELEHRVT
jgi:pSer/pThr/pTyr-binding forkhead associated (FHA) protein